MQNEINPEEAEKALSEKEKTSEIAYDSKVIPIEQGLGKSESFKLNEQNYIDNTNLTTEVGWKRIPIEQLPSEGRFYPEGTNITVRAAAVGEVRHFSTIDETDLLNVDDMLNFMMEKCVKITFPGGKIASFKDLKEEDRFYLIFTVRDVTFVNGENKILFTMKCGTNCLGSGDYSEQIELKNDNFSYYKIDDKLMEFYSAEERCFVINSPKAGMIKLYVPSLGVTTFMKTLIRDKTEKGEFIDKAFLKVAPFMFNDWRTVNNATYTRMQQESMSWSPLKIAACVKLTELIRFGVKTNITKECTKCGAEVTAPITFPDGIKSLFIISNIFRELF